MEVNVKLTDFDIFLRLYLFDGFRAGVIVEFFKYFDGYEFWQEEEKQNEIEKLISEISEGLSFEQKQRLVTFMKKLTDKLTSDS
jgi:hypothetical protein